MNMIQVRIARKNDLEALADLEQEIWRPLGTPILSKDELRSWLEEKSPFFLVAEYEGNVCGYYFGRRVTFSLRETCKFLDPDLVTGRGWSQHSHDSSGNSMYGISMISSVRGAGGALHSKMNELLHEYHIEYSIGFSRLPGFDAFAKEVEEMYEGNPPCNMDETALSYVWENALALKMKCWPHCPKGPGVIVPELRAPDPVLAFHVRGANYGLAGILPKYIVPDPQSRDYGAFIVSQYPHH
jgi:hypothetical protein